MTYEPDQRHGFDPDDLFAWRRAQIATTPAEVDDATADRMIAQIADAAGLTVEGLEDQVLANHDNEAE
jgi:hypothetical protein